MRRKWADHGAQRNIRCNSGAARPPRRARRLAGLVLPMFALCWLYGVGFGPSPICADYRTLIKSAQSYVAECSGFGLTMRSSGESLTAPLPVGDLMMIGNPGVTLPAGKRQMLIDTTFGLATTFPAGTVTVSGQFSSSGPQTDARAAHRPRKVLFNVFHKQGKKTQGKLKIPLKIAGDTIKQSKRSFEGFDLEPGDRVRVEIKPKGADLSLEDAVELFYGFAPSGQTGLDLLQSFAKGSAPPGDLTTRAAVPSGQTLEIFRTVFGVPLDLVSRTIRIEGGFGAGPQLPGSIRVEMIQRDADDNRVVAFRMDLPIDGTRFGPKEGTFPGFTLAAGDSLAFAITPKRGALAGHQTFGFAVMLFGDE